ncbi:lactonase family protein [Pseudomonas sp. NPDC090592]|uniref:lactonase family protein n=1 Tax=Pseudomonas sp. NPDC090592 TaxID=3364480 RepID=UPI00383A2B84
MIEMNNNKKQHVGAGLVAFVGTYGAEPNAKGGGIFVVRVEDDGATLTVTSRVRQPVEAGYLAYAPETHTLYAVDERKTDGRGPVNPPGGVHALRVNPADGSLIPLNWLPAPGPRPTFLAHSAEQNLLVSAHHGDFQHVERVIKDAHGKWVSEFAYDDSTVVVFDLEKDGRLSSIQDVLVLSGHGVDPNNSPQMNGHAQASPHAHCAVIDPTGKWLLVADKGTDRVFVYTLETHPKLVSTCQFPEQTAPRHIAFSTRTRAYMTLELSSEVVTLEFHPDTGQLQILARTSSIDHAFKGHNEPAEIRVHPNGRFVYVNNRGEDSLAWFEVKADGTLKRLGAVQLAKSLHPGVAARSFTFAPQGTFMLVADRPAGLLRAYQVDPDDGSLRACGQVSIPEPAFVAFALL